MLRTTVLSLQEFFTGIRQTDILQVLRQTNINFHYFQDLKTSEGLNDEMKRLADSNVATVKESFIYSCSYT